MDKQELIQSLIDEGYLRTPAIIEAFQKVDRKDFVPEEYRDEAYGNYPLPIGFSQTISQPLTVAFMLELLEPKAGEKILDIGSGSGWQTGLLAHIVGGSPAQGKVIGIERIPELKKISEKNLAKYSFMDPVRNKPPQAAAAVPSAGRISNGVEKNIVKIVEGDGSKGYEEEAPFDKIIAAAAALAVPQAWKDQLKVGGQIVAPVGHNIVLLQKKSPTEFSQKQYYGFSFVPLIVDKTGA